MALGQAQAILDVAHNAFISMDEEGRIVYWNARAEEVFGFTRTEALGQTVVETIIPERYRDAHRRGLSRLLKTGEDKILDQRVELSALRSDGSEFPVEMTISALREHEGWSFHAFVADVSERRAAERERQRLVDELQQAVRGSEQRLSVIVDALAEAITIRGVDDHLIYANRAALERLGFDSVEALRTADPRALMGPYEVTDEHGRAIDMDHLPSVRLLRGEQPEPLLLRSVHRATGEELWALLKATAVRAPNGSIEAAVTIIEDVTQAKRAALRMEFLARASRLLASSLDYQETLRNVAGLAVPQIADWCAVDLFDEQGGREPVAVAHVDPAKLEMAERLRAYEPQELDPDQGLGKARRTGESLLYPHVPDELLAGAAVDEEHLRLLRDVGIRSVLIVPMNIEDRTVGALTLVNAESGRTFDPGDLVFAEQIAERAALAVQNSRLYTERSEVALTLQRSLLPDALPEIPGWEVATLYRPAGRGSEVGGDFYDFWEAPGGDWLMMIGDVTGKGVGAAAVTSLVRHTAWAISEVDASPASILSRVDGALRRRPALSVCTAICLRLSGEQATIAAGGHPLVLCMGESGVQEVGSHGTLLGAFATVKHPETEFTMRPSETLVAFTDGVTDTVGPEGERFGIDRLKETLAAAKNETPTQIRDRVVGALEEFQVGLQADDTALVAMRYTGEVPAPRPSQSARRPTLTASGTRTQSSDPHRLEFPTHSNLKD
jgi:PAS domain S-box-containing protein